MVHADCLEHLKTLESNNLDSLITDPPAGISFMNKEWDHHKGGRGEWIKWMTAVMQECHRVLKPGAHGLVWALPRTSHWTATALEDAGFEIRDIITHLFGTGFPKSLDISKAIDKAAGAEREVTGIKQSFYDDADRTQPFGGYGNSAFDFGNDVEGFNAAKQVQTEPATASAKQWQGWGTAL